MGLSVGAIGLDLKVNGGNLRKQITRETQAAAMSAEGILGNSFKKIGAMATAAFSVAALVKFTKSCLDIGSDLNEVQNVVDTAFPAMSSQVNNFAQQAMTSFGLSELMSKQFMGTFGAMSKAFGFSEKEAYNMSATLTGLAGDVASFYNIDPTESFTKLKSVFTGETETLKDLGVVMTQSALDQYALSNGYGRTTSEMSEQEKVALRLAFVTDKLSMANGDFAKTQNSWANQTRILTLRFQSLKGALGKGLTAVFAPIVKGINWVLANLKPLADSFASLMEMLTGYSGDTGSGGLADTAAGASDAANGISDASDSAADLGKGLSGAGKKGEKAAKQIQRAFGKVDTINKLSFGAKDSGSDDDSDSGALGTGGDVAKTVNFPEATKQGNLFKDMFGDIFDEFNRLAGLFKVGFKSGFGSSFNDLARIKGYLNAIGNSLKSIFTDPMVVAAAKNMFSAIAQSLGEIVGSFASIGTTIITLITGSISTYLSKNKGFLKDKLVQIFNITGATAYLLGEFSTAIADIARVFAGEKAIQIGANLIQAIANGALNFITLISQVGYKIIKAIATPIIENKEAIKKAINQALTPIIDITGKIADTMTDWNSFIKVVGGVAAAFLGFKTAAALVANSGLISTLTTGISLFGAGIKEGSGFLTSFSALFPKLGGAMSTAGTAVSTLATGVASGNGVLASLQAVLPTSISSFSGLGTTLLGLVNPVTIVIASITALVAGFTYLYTTSSSFRDKINAVFSSVATQVGGVITGLVDIIKTIWSAGVGPVVTNTITAFQNLWDNGLAVFIENVSLFVGKLIELVMGVWNNAVNPFIELLLNTFLPIFTTVWNGILAVATPIINNIMSLVNDFMSVVNILMDLLNKNVLPIFKTVFKGISEAVKSFYDMAKPHIDNFMTLLSSVIDFAQKLFLAPLKIVFKTVVEVVKAIKEPIASVIDGVKTTFKGIIDFVTGIFTGNWRKAWGGVKNIFKGMWNSLSGIVSTVWKTITGLFGNAGKIFSGVVEGISKVFKSIINCIIDGMNRVIRIPFDKINGILNGIRSFKIPLVGRPFEGLWGENPLPVPQIPKLAQGGYVKANQPQLAMIGDNRHQGEVVAPEGKLADLLDEALARQKQDSNVAGITEIISLLKQLIAAIASLSLSVDIDRKKLAILLRAAEKELDMIGG